MPRDMARFHAYLARLQAEGSLVAPLVAANPMARGHMLDLLDRLDALGADRALAEAAEEASRRLARSPVESRLSLVPVDDVGGAWSERTMVDFDLRFGSKRPKKDYGYVTGAVYASEDVTPALVRERLLAAAYRAAHVRRHGHAETLRAMLAQEGRALVFAGAEGPRVADVEHVRRALAPHLDARTHATRFAAMYGDRAAERCGHKPLGLPDDAGFALALADARASREKPEDEV